MIDCGQWDAIRDTSASRAAGLAAKPWPGTLERAAGTLWLEADSDVLARFVRRCRAIRRGGRVPRMESRFNAPHGRDYWRARAYMAARAGAELTSKESGL